jgi:hypothetical protein
VRARAGHSQPGGAPAAAVAVPALQQATRERAPPHACFTRAQGPDALAARGSSKRPQTHTALALAVRGTINRWRGKTLFLPALQRPWRPPKQTRARMTPHARANTRSRCTRCKPCVYAHMHGAARAACAPRASGCALHLAPNANRQLQLQLQLCGRLDCYTRQRCSCQGSSDPRSPCCCPEVGPPGAQAATLLRAAPATHTRACSSANAAVGDFAAAGREQCSSCTPACPRLRSRSLAASAAVALFTQPHPASPPTHTHVHTHTQMHTHTAIAHTCWPPASVRGTARPAAASGLLAHQTPPGARHPAPSPCECVVCMCMCVCVCVCVCVCYELIGTADGLAGVACPRPLLDTTHTRLKQPSNQPLLPHTCLRLRWC